MADTLQEVAKSGHSTQAWSELKHVICAKIEEVCAEYYASNKDIDAAGESYQEVLQRLKALLAEFPNAPFTVQRLCELLLDPHRVYFTSTRKVMSALEKLLTVSSTVPIMQSAPPKPGSYQAAAEFELGKLLSGEQPGEGGDAQPMDVEG
jgi:serine/threonine-protein phosphatase 4 regulatory subunit 2